MYIKPLKGKDAKRFWDAFYKSGIRKEALEKASKSFDNNFDKNSKSIEKEFSNNK